MSTTSDVNVAIKYAASASSLLLRLRTDTMMQRGASLAFLSAFPAEAEGAQRDLTLARGDAVADLPCRHEAVLFPPLTFLKPSGKHVVKTEDGFELTIIDVVPVLA